MSKLAGLRLNGNGKRSVCRKSVKHSVRLSSDARADHYSYACLATRQPLAEFHIFGAKTSRNRLILHPIGRPIHLGTLKKMAMKGLIFSHFR